MKKVLVTGATGFIGSTCVPLLLQKGYKVYAISMQPREEPDQNVHWIQADLLEQRNAKRLMEDIQPTHLLHLSWYVVPGKYLIARENLLWVQASLELLHQFIAYGGRRVVVAGTCFEYDVSYGYCTEDRTPRQPQTIYGMCKHALEVLVEAEARRAGISSAWGRIFFLYGPNEYKERFIPSIICSLLKDETANCTHGKQVRDFLYVEDVANAFVELLDSDVIGAVNIGSGQPTTLKEVVNTISLQLQKENLIKLGSLTPTIDEPQTLFANNSRLLHEVGWMPQYDLARGIEKTIAWWRVQLEKDKKILHV